MNPFDQKRLAEELEKRTVGEITANPEKYHLLGWLRGGINAEKMAKIAEEKGAEVMSGHEWTPEQKDKFKATLARKREEKGQGPIVDGETDKNPVAAPTVDDKRIKKTLRDREIHKRLYRDRRAAKEVAGVLVWPQPAASICQGGACIHQGVCKFFVEG